MLQDELKRASESLARLESGSETGLGQRRRAKVELEAPEVRKQAKTRDDGQGKKFMHALEAVIRNGSENSQKMKQAVYS